MKYRKSSLTLLLVATIAASSCQSSQQLLETNLAAATEPAKPAFMEELVLEGNGTNLKLEVSGQAASTISPFATNVLQQKYAALLRVLPAAVTNLSLYSFIEEWYGVKYRMGGNDKSGIDCSAFVQRLYENVFCTNLVRTTVEQFRMCQLVFCPDSLQEGDLVFFKTRGKKRITHVGIYLANNFFVHASSSQGVTISSLQEAYWARYYAGAGKVLDRACSF